MKKIVISLLSVILVLSVLLWGSAVRSCRRAGCRRASRRGASCRRRTGSEISGSVGIVLPTKEEPRWIQDETRFNDLLTEAGYDVEILFSQSSSAKEEKMLNHLLLKVFRFLSFAPMMPVQQQPQLN